MTQTKVHIINHTHFPMHDFVALANEEKMAAILAKGIHSYATTESGTIALHLRRAVEWVTEANLRDRIGDAGPFFYVPDAGCERVVRHEVAVAIGLKSVVSTAFQSLLAAYQNPPLLVRHKGHGKENSWQSLQESIPMSSLRVLDPRLAAATGAEHLRLQHQSYIWQREKLEFELSLLLNQRKLGEAGTLRHGYLYEPDKEIAAIGLALNRLRIKRRIFDYVIQAV